LIMLTALNEDEKPTIEQMLIFLQERIAAEEENRPMFFAIGETLNGLRDHPIMDNIEKQLMICESIAESLLLADPKLKGKIQTVIDTKGGARIVITNERSSE
jgi:hypothetical protein